MQGKIRAIPVTTFKVGDQVVRRVPYDEVHWKKPTTIYKHDGLDYYSFDGHDWSAWQIREKFYQLVVEYETRTLKSESFRDTPMYRCTTCECVLHTETDVCNCNNTIKQLPLKYSQWQAAINAGEVDSDKVVDFEVRHMDRTHEVYFDTNHGGTIQIAKFIPQKEEKISLTKVELSNLIYTAICSGDIKVERSRDNGGITSITGITRWVDKQYPQ